MAFPYNGFPVNYPYYAPAYQPPYNNFQPQQMPINQPQPTQAQAQQTAQVLTPPTIHADIIQVQDKQAVIDYPLAVGVSQMFMTRDESAIYIKTTYANSQPTIAEYPRKETAPVSASPEIDLHNYVTWDSLERRLAEIIQPQGEIQKSKKKGADD